VRIFVLNEIEYFSAKDAKDAKKSGVAASVLGATAPVQLRHFENLDLSCFDPAQSENKLQWSPQVTVKCIDQ
jgi:hypothetical protein